MNKRKSTFLLNNHIHQDFQAKKLFSYFLQQPKGSTTPHGSQRDAVHRESVECHVPTADDDPADLPAVDHGPVTGTKGPPSATYDSIDERSSTPDGTDYATTTTTTTAIFDIEA